MTNKELKERPILFSAPMVRAILDGRKTQTRRVVKPQPNADNWTGKCRYGQRGDRLWVRETWQSLVIHDGLSPSDIPVGADIQYPATYDGWVSKRRPSIHMPRWASRITLEITGIRVERLQDISENDAVAEGVEFWTPTVDVDPVPSPRPAYRLLWESINGAGSWGLNPWVFVIEFKRVTP